MLDMPLVIAKLESQGLLRTKRQTGDYMTCYCPFHNNGNERRPSCGILLHEKYKGGTTYPAGFTHCFSCGYANPIEQAITDMLEQHDIHQTGVDWLKQNIEDYEESSDFEYLLSKDLLSSVESKYAVDYVKRLSDVKQEYVSEEELAKYRYTVPYMYERKLNDYVINLFDVGFDPLFSFNKRKIPSITFPVNDENGNTLFIYRRSIEGKFHNYPKDVLKPVYGLDKIPKGTEEIIICESIINALTLWTYGFIAVALLGTGNSYQIFQLKKLGVKSFVLCMDGDDAGRKGTAKLYNMLSDVAIVWRIDMIEGQDVNSIEKSKFIELYNNKY